MNPGSRSKANTDQRVIVGAHPWVYAATQPRYDIYPVLDQIFADVAYAGIEGLELMHTALHPADSVERISALIDKHHLPVIGIVLRRGDVGPRSDTRSCSRNAR